MCGCFRWLLLFLDYVLRFKIRKLSLILIITKYKTKGYQYRERLERRIYKQVSISIYGAQKSTKSFLSCLIICPHYNFVVIFFVFFTPKEDPAQIQLSIKSGCASLIVSSSYRMYEQ